MTRIFCIEQNYFSHKREQRSDISIEPVVFQKPLSSLSKTNDVFQFPDFARELYCRCELVLRISKRGKNIKEIMAVDYYDSITVGINFIAPGNKDQLNEEELTWEKATAWENSSITGKWIPAINCPDKKDINFCFYKNRELVQLGNSALMINNFDKIICHISNSFSINRGDIIFTGAPAGISNLLRGDKVEAFIEDDSLLEFGIE